jgi:hypothetical protein
MPTETEQTIDLQTLRLAWDDRSNDHRRNTTGKIEYCFIERPSGRVRYKSTGYRDEPSAQAFVKALKGDLAEHQHGQADEPTFAEVLDLYVRSKRGKENSFAYKLRKGSCRCGATASCRPSPSAT